MQSPAQQRVSFPQLVVNPLHTDHAHSAVMNSPQRGPPVRRPCKRLSRRRRVHHWLCSLPTVVAGIYFILLVLLAVIVATTTQVKITSALQQSWSYVHQTKCGIAHRSVSSVASFVHETALTTASLFTQSDYCIESNNTLVMLCATIDKVDPNFTLRSLALGNLQLAQYAAARHGDPEDPSMRNITVLLSNNDHFYGVFYVDPDTYEYYDPPQLKGAMNQSQTAQQMISEYASTDPIFGMIEAVANGTLQTIPLKQLWNFPALQPSFILYTLPILLMGVEVLGKHYVDVYDHVQLRIDGSALLSRLPTFNKRRSSRTMILANATLTSGDAIVVANNWLQEVVHNATYTVLVDTNTSYLRISKISDPLMRAAVKHVDLSALQYSGYNHTTVFRYRHATAMVTAVMYTTPTGLEVPMVVVSSQESVTGPFMLIADICTGMLGLSVALLTVLCYFSIERCLSRPLRRVTAAMDASLQRGVRQPVRTVACDVVQLAETRELTAAYNTAMTQLRAVDEFVPDGVQGNDASNPRRSVLVEAQQQRELRSRYLTVLTVHIRRAAFNGPPAPDLFLTDTRQGGTVVPVTASGAAHAACATAMTNHGPFATAADLGGFVTAVLRCSAEHRGTVHRLTPDFCVLHFGAAASTAAPDSADTTAPPAPATQRRISRDAQDAVGFGFALLHWADTQVGRRIPDIRLLADTGVFTCGQYKAAGSEQTLSVAFGRDVDRSLGHIPSKIGVRFAVTEETANCVRAGRCGGVLAGVRQIPVEAFRTGRVGLDADVVVLYEVLPGAAVGDAAWQRYAERCFDGFARMLRGDYAAALTSLRGVADITDLEPGLLPRSFRREAARTRVKGGAHSSQVERLMCECERRMATHWTQGFHRTPIRLLGVDVVLASMARERLLGPRSSTDDAAEADRLLARSRSRSRLIASAGEIEKRRGRYGLNGKNPQSLSSAVRVVSVLPGTATRTSYTGVPQSFQDNWGKMWRVGKTPASQHGLEMHARVFSGLSDGGTVGITGFHLYRDVPPIVSEALKGVPPGPLSAAARHAVPLWLPSPMQREAVHKLFGPCLRLRHSNVLTCLGYSIAYEGGVVVVSEFFKGVSLRELRRQFPGVWSHATVARLGCSVVKALLFLHANGVVHGELRPDCVSVCSDGVCRLNSFFTNYELAHRVLCLPRTCYVSPEVAAGLVPTAASDIFGFGLVMLELVTAERPWVWVPVVGEGPQRSVAELAALMCIGGDAFGELVAQRLVMPAVDELDRVFTGAGCSTAMAFVIRRCLEWRAEDRLPLKTALNAILKAGRVRRSHLSAHNSLLHFGDSEEDTSSNDETGKEEDGESEKVNGLIQIFF